MTEGLFADLRALERSIGAAVGASLPLLAPEPPAFIGRHLLAQLDDAYQGQCVRLCARARGPPLDQLATHVVCCARRGCGLAFCARCRGGSDVALPAAAVVKTPVRAEPADRE